MKYLAALVLGLWPGVALAAQLDSLSPEAESLLAGNWVKASDSIDALPTVPQIDAATARCTEAMFSTLVAAEEQAALRAVFSRGEAFGDLSISPHGALYLIAEPGWFGPETQRAQIFQFAGTGDIRLRMITRASWTDADGWTEYTTTGIPFADAILSEAAIGEAQWAILQVLQPGGSRQTFVRCLA